MSEEKKAGRRSGNPDTKDDILTAARDLFALNTFRQVTIRDIADRAEVDPALIHHYFGTKRDLFHDAVDLPLDVADRIRAGLGDVDLSEIGHHVARTVVGVWESEHSDRLLAIMRNALADPAQTNLLRNIFQEQVLRAVKPVLEGRVDRIELRVSLIAMHVFGLVTTRYIIGLEPLSDLSAGELIDVLGPDLQGIVDMEL
ncbi:TetR family transcriptional regulator [Haloglycomyces albus]|uniref:TetR/AcrR family transcriptional regulator n=1 Tax=Haloglycomyces albus TaxID=526067 RepID=UPI00046D8111|nr:TetR family transcriptional regulator [Haloglycomyces albus]